MTTAEPEAFGLGDGHDVGGSAAQLDGVRQRSLTRDIEHGVDPVQGQCTAPVDQTVTLQHGSRTEPALVVVVRLAGCTSEAKLGGDVVARQLGVALGAPHGPVPLRRVRPR